MNKDRIKEYIYSFCDGKQVLHLGFAGDIFRYQDSLDQWDFSHLNKRAANVLGIDLDAKAVEKAKELGYLNVMVGDAQNFSLNRTFDVIYAGELIEHVDNLGDFLESVKKHASKDTRIILTTPNPFAINNFFRAVITGKPRVLSEHVSFICRDNFEELARRHNLRIVEFRFFTPYDQRGWVTKCKSWLVGVLGRLRPVFHSNYLVIVHV